MGGGGGPVTQTVNPANAANKDNAKKLPRLGAEETLQFAVRMAHGADAAVSAAQGGKPCMLRLT